MIVYLKYSQTGVQPPPCGPRHVVVSSDSTVIYKCTVLIELTPAYVGLAHPNPQLTIPTRVGIVLSKTFLDGFLSGTAAVVVQNVRPVLRPTSG